MGGESGRAYDVFLSYSSHDKAWADAACAVLERRGLRCWIAPRDITPGDEWGAAIIKGINASRMMVLIFSGHANASGQVHREVERAISGGMAVLPIRVEDVRPEGAMEFALGNRHWLDAFSPPVERHLERIARSARTLLGDDAGPDLGDPTSTPAPGRGRQHVAPGPGPGPGPRHLVRLVVALAVMLAVMVVAFVFVMSRDRTVRPGAGASARSVAEATPGSDEERIQGRWQVVEQYTPKSQNRNLASDIARTTWTFQGRELTISALVAGEEQVKNRGSFSLGKDERRKLFDYVTTKEGQPIEFSGIYEFDGEFLRVCHGVRLDPANNTAFRRPDSFAVQPGGSRRVYLKFKRSGD